MSEFCFAVMAARLFDLEGVDRDDRDDRFVRHCREKEIEVTVDRLGLYRDVVEVFEEFGFWVENEDLLDNLEARGWKTSFLKMDIPSESAT